MEEKKYRILWYQTTFYESYVTAIDEHTAIEKAHNGLDVNTQEIENENSEELFIVELQEVEEIPEVEESTE